MAEPLADQVMRMLKKSAGLYHRLTLVVAPSGSGKTTALREAASGIGTTLINVNLELSKRMLDLTARQRALQVPRLLDEIAGQISGDTLLLDNLEILFDVALKQDPLRLLQGLSRNRAVAATWNGLMENNHLTYAAPDHHEYRRYPLGDFLVASLAALR